VTDRADVAEADGPFAGSAAANAGSVDAEAAVTVDALPASVAALFSERDGTRGRMLFVEERPDASTWDGRYLVAWARAIRAVRTPDGRAPLVVGRAPIFADMISAIKAAQKAGRNDPCPCGSGKKFKVCCGK
jgi:hypothetical protein